MKKLKQGLIAMALVVALINLSSCATVFGGQVSECQRTKPAAGQPSRQIRAAALVCDIVLFWPGIIVDFATNAIYRPCTSGGQSKASK
jgi:hypothetical protein